MKSQQHLIITNEKIDSTDKRLKDMIICLSANAKLYGSTSCDYSHAQNLKNQKNKNMLRLNKLKILRCQSDLRIMFLFFLQNIY